MFQIALQIVAAMALLVAAIRIQRSLHRRRDRDWHAILKGFRDGHGRLSGLSYSAVVSEDSDCSESEIWSRVYGVVGLWRMYMNMEVLLEAIDFVAKECGYTPDVVERIKRVRADALNAQMLIALVGLKAVVAPVRRPRPSVVSETIKTYTASIDHFRLVLNECSPNLLRSFRYFVTRQ